MTLALANACAGFAFSNACADVDPTSCQWKTTAKNKCHLSIWLFVSTNMSLALANACADVCPTPLSVKGNSKNVLLKIIWVWLFFSTNMSLAFSKRNFWCGSRHLVSKRQKQQSDVFLKMIFVWFSQFSSPFYDFHKWREKNLDLPTFPPKLTSAE